LLFANQKSYFSSGILAFGGKASAPLDIQAAKMGATIPKAYSLIILTPNLQIVNINIILFLHIFLFFAFLHNFIGVFLAK